MRIENNSETKNLKVAYQSPSVLNPYVHNPRTHSNKQIRQLAASIKEFGFTNPILVDGNKGVIAGHGRLEAAKSLGIHQVPTIQLANMSEAQKRAYILADNKLAENAGWDKDLLALELQGLLDMDADFEITTTGFEMGEIDFLIGELNAVDDSADITPQVSDTPPISTPGDLWQLGAHRLLCGDALEADSFAKLMAGERAEMVFADPPYNVAINGHVSGLGLHKHSEFAFASGEMSESEFVVFLQTALQNMVDVSVNGAMHFICMDWRHLYELQTAGRNVYSELKNLCVWTKTNGGMGSLYRSQHELVAVFKAGTDAHINNVDLGRHGRYRTNVWSYAGMNSFGSERDDALATHPTVKPVQLVEDAVLDCSNRNGIVLDAFAGSGTTIIAAERAGRYCYAMEYEPAYVDVMLKRYRAFSGNEPVHVASGFTFSELE